MENVEKLVKQAREILDSKLEELKVLEAEKQEIISQYEIANQTGKSLLEIKMKNSEAKYKKLYEEVLTLSEKVKILKKKSY